MNNKIRNLGGVLAIFGLILISLSIVSLIIFISKYWSGIWLLFWGTIILFIGNFMLEVGE